jgi:hypothetical protein
VALGHTERGGDGGAGVGGGVGGDEVPEVAEEVGPACLVVVLSQGGEGPADQGEGPVALEEAFGGLVVGGLAEEAPLGVAGVDREGGPAAAALQGA